MKQLLVIMLTISMLPACLAGKTIADWRLEVDGHVYNLIPGRYTWEQARRKASDLGGQLACIKSSALNEKIYKHMMEGLNRTILIGCYKWGGKWLWVDGAEAEWIKYT